MTMRRIPRILFSLALLAQGCSVLDPSPEAEISRSVDAVPTDPSKLSGEQLFLNHCTSCHNPDGSPVDPTTITDLRNYAGSYQKFDSVLNQGPGPMPIFPYDQLDTLARRKVYDHVRTFR